MGFCISCGSELAPGTGYCTRCGAAANAGANPICTNCGTERSGANEKFCKVCGHQYDTTAPQAPPTPTIVAPRPSATGPDQYVDTSRRRPWGPIAAAIALVPVIGIGGFLIWNMMIGSGNGDVAEESEVTSTSQAVGTTATTEADFIAPPTVVVSSSGRLPALPSSTEVPVTEDPAVGLIAPAVTGVDGSGETVTFGSVGAPELVIIATVNDNSEGTVDAAASLIDASGRVSGVDTILVVSGEGTAALKWLGSSGWQGRALIDNSGSILLDSYGVSLTPHVVAIDADGRIAARASGTLDPADIRLVSLAALTGPVAATSAPTSTSLPAAATTTVTARDATLYSNFAKVRELPHIDAAEVATLIDRDGMAIAVLGPNQNGWYRIRAGTVEGWLFGTFVLPPDPGLYVAQTLGGETAVLLDEHGNAANIENESGPKVLVLDRSGDLWKVLLPSGDTAWVDPTVMRIVS